MMETMDQPGCYEVMRRVTGVLQRLSRRGSLLGVRLGKKMRDGRVTHHVQWQRDKSQRFVIDIEANAVVLPGILPASLRPQLPRDVLAFLRNEGCLDPDRGELRMFVKHGALTLSVTFRDGQYEDCTEYVVRLADRVLSEFSERPSYEAAVFPPVPHGLQLSS